MFGIQARKKKKKNFARKNIKILRKLHVLWDEMQDEYIEQHIQEALVVNGYRRRKCPSSNLNEAVWISHNANTVWESLV